MLAIKKPRNARSKRALEKRQPQLNEPVKTALVVNASQSSALIAKALHQLSAIKKPNVISFSRKKSNEVNPFVDTASLEFLSQKNDTPLMLIGDSRKKRKDNLTWVRLFDGRVLDMLEMGVDKVKETQEFKPPSIPDIGARPLFHFSGPQFASDAASIYPAHAHLKSLLLDFYRGEEVLENGIPTGGQVAMQGGMQFVISITAGGAKDKSGSSSGEDQQPTLADLYASGAAGSSNGAGNSFTAVDTSAAGAKIFFRTFALTTPTKTPARAVPSQLRLDECGPSFDFVLRRRLPSDPMLLSQSLKRGKTQAEKNRQGKSDTYKKNIETDEMGNMIGRVHVGKQDLNKLQTRKMKGLKAGRDGGSAESVSDTDDGDLSLSAEDSDEEQLFDRDVSEESETDEELIDLKELVEDGAGADRSDASSGRKRSRRA